MARFDKYGTDECNCDSWSENAAPKGHIVGAKASETKKEVEDKLISTVNEVSGFVENYGAPACILVCKKIKRVSEDIASATVAKFGLGKSIGILIAGGLILLATLPFWGPVALAVFLIAVITVALSNKR